MATDWMLYVRQRSIDNVWRLVVNQRSQVARLTTGAVVQRWYSLPAGSLRDGPNCISFVPDTPTDDVVIGDVRLVERSAREVFDLQKLSRASWTAADANPLPARVTLVGQGGTKPMLLFATPAATAARDGGAVPRRRGDGRSRGAARTRASRRAGANGASRAWRSRLAAAPASLELHAAPRSRHVGLRRRRHAPAHAAILRPRRRECARAAGDARGRRSAPAIATDHNHQTDYGVFQRELGLQRWFTPVVGNEVTTDVGHFNGFPFDPAMPRAPFRSRDIVTIVQGMRGASVRRP